MNRKALVALVIAIAAAVCSAQAPAVLLSNAENLELYYLIDPPGLTGPDTSSAVFMGKVVSFFSQTEPSVDWSRLEPLGVERVDGLREGPHVFVGLFLLRNAAELPVRVVRLQVGMGIEERLYTIYREPATVTVRSGAGRLAALTAGASAAATAGGEGESSGASTASTASTAGGIAAQAADTSPAAASDSPTGVWRRVEPMVTFTGAFEPESVIRQTAQGSTIIPFSRASYWGVDGVRLRDLRLVRNVDELAFRVQTFGSMSPSESLLLYVQENRAGGQDNRITLELTPAGDGKSGYVLLWLKGTPRPVIVGRFVQQANVVIGRIRDADLDPHADLWRARSRLTMDVVTAHYEPDRGVFEEFYHATIRVDLIPALDDAGQLFL